MRGRERWALAVRRPSGEVSVTVNPTRTLAQRYPRWNNFPVRGIFAFVDSMVIGVKALMISGAIYAADASAEPAPQAAERQRADADQGAAGRGAAAG